ncbi:MAG: anmK [Proteobacteria bacterium]|nr:anmK [Pseudomonadota bacterium]
MSGDSAMWALGLMSGTSMDGVDAALIRTDGEGIAEFGPTLFQPYGDEERAVLRAALKDACGMTARDDRFGRLAEAESVVTDAHAHAVAVLLIAAEKKGIRPEVIGFHGQTVHHAPDRGFTAQIGDAGVLAERFNLPVVHDFRSADIREGGQGAPLVPIYHRALAQKAGLVPPVAFLNIGGVANVTLIGEGGELTAFDTGPGNALIDDLVFNATGARFDVDGAIAAQGRVDDAVLVQLMDHPHFETPAPKSLDRNTFRADAAARLPFADRVATLTAFTAEGVAAGLRLAGAPVRTVIVSGGGARNPVMVRMIAERTGVEVVPAGKIGFDADFVEAQAFAYLAARRLKGLPSSFPTTTGTPVPVVCGEIA